MQQTTRTHTHGDRKGQKGEIEKERLESRVSILFSGSSLGAYSRGMRRPRSMRLSIRMVVVRVRLFRVVDMDTFVGFLVIGNSGFQESSQNWASE